MEQEDYIKRQIDQLGRALGKILADLMGLKSHGRISEGMEAANLALKTELGLNIDDLTLIPDESFLATLLDKKKFSDNNFEQLAEILFIIAEELNNKNTDPGKMKNICERALIIFEILDRTGPIYSFDRHSKIVKIKQML